jgi:hypothetical protein
LEDFFFKTRSSSVLERYEADWNWFKAFKAMLEIAKADPDLPSWDPNQTIRQKIYDYLTFQQAKKPSSDIDPAKIAIVELLKKTNDGASSSGSMLST